MKTILKIIIISGLILSCGDQVSINHIANQIASDTLDAEQYIDDAKITLTNNNRATAKIKAKKIKQFDETMLLAENGLNIYFLGEQGDTVSNLTADNGKINQITKNMEAFGNVIVTNQEGVKLYTDRLRWNNKKEIIYSNDSVKIVKDKDFLIGAEFEATADLKTYHVNKIYANTFKNLGNILK